MVELLITYMVELAKEGVEASVGWEEGRVTVAKMPFAHLEYDHYSDDDYDYDVNINILPPCLLCSHPQPVAQVVGEDSYSGRLPEIIEITWASANIVFNTRASAYVVLILGIVQ